MPNDVVSSGDRTLTDALCSDVFHGVRLALRELVNADAVRVVSVSRRHGSPDRRALVETTTGVRLVIWRRTRVAVMPMPPIPFTSSGVSVESAKPQPAPAYAREHRSYVTAPRKYPSPKWAGENGPKDF